MKRYSSILGPVDSAFYYVEKPETPMNIGALSIFEGKIDFDEFVRLVNSRLHRAPRYFQRIVQAPFHLGQPTWIQDPDFYIGKHIKRASVPLPGTEEQLRTLVGRLLSSTLSRSKPLWEIHFIDGLPDRTAIFFKVHHCMVDGLAAVELFTMLMDLDPQVGPLDEKVPLDTDELPDPITLTIDSVQRDFMHRLQLLQKLADETSRLFGLMGDSGARLKTLTAIAHLINNNLKPIQKLPINGVNSGQQKLVWAEFPLDDIHAIRKPVGASVNEVMMTLLTAAVHAYCRRRRPTEQPFLRLLVPVNVREDAEKGSYGNRISVMPVDIPLDAPDPLSRLKAASKFSTIMKESSLSLTMDLVLTLPSLLPAVVQPLIWSAAPVAFSLLAHTWCTNVAATPIPVYLLGHRLEHVYGYFPLNPTMGIACVIVSYNGRITMTLVVDENIIPDPEVLERGLKDAYAELRQASGLTAPSAPVVSAVTTVPAAVAAPAPAVEAPLPPVEIPAPTVTAPEPAAPSDALVSERAVSGDLREETAQIESVRDDRLTQVHVVAAEAVSTVESKTHEVTDHAALAADVPAEASEAAAQPAPTAEMVSAASVDIGVIDAAPEIEIVAVSVPPQPAQQLDMQPSTTQAVPVSSQSPNGKTPPAAPHKLFSDEWAKAFREVINQSEAYRRAGANWTAGTLVFIMNASPAHGFAEPAAVYMDLHRGQCRGARALTVSEAARSADFIIAGDYAAWMEVLSGKSSPLVMLSTGRLHLQKGSMLKLLPHTRSATELVNCARRVPWH